MFDVKKYAALARKAAAEGCVLLENRENVLPLKKGCKAAGFGIGQFHYFKSGTGSGGGVNTSYVVSILDALQQCDDITLDKELLDVYTVWQSEHTEVENTGWAQESWSFSEMPLEEEIVEAAAKRNDVAIISIARRAGEDKDNAAKQGSYLLTEEEERMLELVCRHFDKTVVLLNTGNIMDMKWVKTYEPNAVLYVWQGGQEGGNAVLDVLMGAVNPSGKLPDTIAYDITDYPSTRNFGNEEKNIYAEDIFVGYRYFETFAKDKVLYPFGYGLSYTTFDIKPIGYRWDGNTVYVRAFVTNTGHCAGKEVVQLYAKAPQGALGKAERVLCAFSKTMLLNAGDSQVVELSCDKYAFSSFDDSGRSGHRFAYVLEAGEYVFYVGNSIRCEQTAGQFTLHETQVVQQLESALAPTQAFERMCAKVTEDGSVALAYEETPQRTYDLWNRIVSARPQELEYTGNKGYKLADVKKGHVSMEAFVAQIPDKQLSVLFRGEGMCSPKVTPGTGGAFGGLSPALQELGIPVACCTDGPSGIRMDVGTFAFSLPNGTCLAASFNEALSEALFEMMGVELRKNKIEVLLGPGMNIHRNPLNGRNFEYFSEDPYLTGKMVVAQLKGMHKHNVTGSIKHFAANNQEAGRRTADSVVSERALREIYLKGFEIACKEGKAYCVMSTYGPLNGIWTAGNYDLLTQVLRKEWNFKGIVMSDWWARANEEGQNFTVGERAAMVRAQNDLYMVTADAEDMAERDNLIRSLGTEKVTRGELQRTAMNVLRFIMQSPVMERYMHTEANAYKVLCEQKNAFGADEDCVEIAALEAGEIKPEQFTPERGHRDTFGLYFDKAGAYKLEMTVRAVAETELAQIPMSIFKNELFVQTVSLTGEDKEWRTVDVTLGHVAEAEIVKLSFFFGQGGMEIAECNIVEA